MHHATFSTRSHLTHPIDPTGAAADGPGAAPLPRSAAGAVMLASVFNGDYVTHNAVNTEDWGRWG